MRTDPSYRIAIPSSSVKHFASLARRLSRIFAHAYFHHREVFEHAEADNALYERYGPFTACPFSEIHVLRTPTSPTTHRDFILTDVNRFLGLVREFNLVPPEFLVINWEDRPIRSSSHPASMALAIESQSPTSGNSDNLTPVDNDALTRSPLGGRRRTDTMYFSGDFNVLDPTFGIGSFDEGDGPHLEVPKVPSEGQEESDEWVLPERAYGSQHDSEVLSHEQEDEGIPVEVAIEQDVAPEVEVEKSMEGYKEPRPTPSEEDPFADNSADISETEVEAQLETSIDNPAEGEGEGEERIETVVETDKVVDEAPMEKEQEGSGAEVAETADVAMSTVDVSGNDAVEEEEHKD